MKFENATNTEETFAGDWHLIDLTDAVPAQAVAVAHAIGMEFEEFLSVALEEKIALVAKTQTSK